MYLVMLLLLLLMMMMITTNINQKFKLIKLINQIINYKCYKSRVDKDKKLSVKQYLYKIMPYLSDIKNDHKTIRNESNKSKI